MIRKKDLLHLVTIFSILCLCAFAFWGPGRCFAQASDSHYQTTTSIFCSGGERSGDGSYSLDVSVIGQPGSIDTITGSRYKLLAGYVPAGANTPPVITTPVGDKYLTQGEEFKLTLDAEDYDGQPVYWEASHLPSGGAEFAQDTASFVWDTAQTICNTGAIEYKDIFFLVADHDPDNMEDPENYKAKIEAWIAENNFNIYGDPTGTVYNGNPLIDQATGQGWNRYHYILNNHPNLAAILNLGIDYRTPSYVLACCSSPVMQPMEDQTISVNSQLSFTLKASDPEGGEITFGARDLPAGAVINSTTGLFTWTPNQPGTYYPTFTAANDCAQAVDQVCITVGDVVVIVYQLTSGYNPVGSSWNLSGVISKASDICSLIDSQTGQKPEILRYNPLTSDWDRFMCQYNCCQDFPIEPLKGYFINTAQPLKWTVSGGKQVDSPATIDLAVGYNCLALPQWMGNQTASDFLALINAQEAQCNKVLVYDPVTASWSYHLTQYPSYNNFTIKPGQAFFVSCQTPGQFIIAK